MDVKTVRTSLLSLLVVALVRHVDSVCTKVDDCSCRDSETGELISLGSLAHHDGTPAFSIAGPNADYSYTYNPCVAFTEVAGTQCEDVAMCQAALRHSPVEYYNLGNQSSADFVSANGTLSIVYHGSQTHEGSIRMSDIQLICNKEATIPELKFLREAELGQYYLSLETRCACPGVCSPQKKTCLPESDDKCSCRLSDGGGQINIGSLNQPSSPLTAKTGTATVTINPCTGIDVGPSETECRDVTVCLQQAGVYRDYGVASSAEFSFNDQDELMLSYKSKDQTRQSSIELVCDPAQRHYPKLLFKGEPTSTQVNMELRSVCACPGECFEPVKQCLKTDDCSCQLEDGSLSLSLRDLDNPFAPLYANHTDQWKTFYDFYYNPCTKMTIPTAQENCTDVALCQSIPNNRENFNLGLQEGVTFRVSSTEFNTVVVTYMHGGDDRISNLEVHCNRNATVPAFSFIDEQPYKYYRFSLESSVACFKQNSEQRESVPARHRQKVRSRI